jgi:ATP-dependent DNA helicase RecG
VPAKTSLDSGKNRSEGLDYLFSDIQYLKGVGPKKGDALKKNGIKTVFDLFYYVPRKYLDRSLITPLNQLEEGMTVTVLGTVVAFGEIRRRKRLYKVIIENNRAELELVWFTGYRYMQDTFSEGDVICVSGTVRRYGGLNIPHPEFEVVGSADDETIHTGRLIPIYPENALFKSMGLHSRGLRRIIKPALDHLAQHPCETIPEKWRKEYGLYDLTRAIYQIHFPEKVETADSGRQRLAFEELFYLELILAGRKNNRRKKMTGVKIGPPKQLGRRLLDNLGFNLTKAQVKVLNEIYEDMLGAIENGFQVTVMAPTEILAEQHYYSMTELLRPLGITTTMITGSIRGAGRKSITESISSGEASVVIGTHALIQKKIDFKNLGFVVIDEQHKFGVAQRGVLLSKGLNPDILVMSATPIPRTLAMTLYGDLDISVIDEMPPGRIPVNTKHVPEDKRDQMYDFVRNAVKDGQSAYLIYPLVEETEKSDLKAATEGYEILNKDVFPELNVGLLHGRMKGEEKHKIMIDFRDKKIDILVATTVVEVGLDIPSATVMLIEHAERFGLSQLHQLRGRVGRSGIKSYCFLMTGSSVTEDASRRIEAMTEISDGFKISEIDLQIRGPGEILGTRQHGMPELKVADLTDTRLISLARRLAFDMIAEDPGLNSDENRYIKTVLKMRMGKKLKYSKIA